MAVNKVVYGDTTLVDLTNDTVTPETLAKGVTAHAADGSLIVGVMELTTERIEKLSTDTAVELESNKLYVFPEMESLTITLAEPGNTAIVNEYHFVFQSGASATALTIPGSIKVPTEFSVEANKIYEISILEGCLCEQNWEVTA